MFLCLLTCVSVFVNMILTCVSPRFGVSSDRLASCPTSTHKYRGEIDLLCARLMFNSQRGIFLPVNLTNNNMLLMYFVHMKHHVFSSAHFAP